MNPFFSSLIPIVLATAVSFSAESKKPAHEHEEKADGSEAHDAKDTGHDEKEEHSHGAEGAEHSEEEESPSVGPEKGILSADEHVGFKLSPEAIKSFELQTQKLNGTAPWKLPRAALLLAREERNVFRSRDGNYKRIDFKVVKETADSMVIQSVDLRPGDEVVIKGLGFLRIAELAAFGGAPEGHSH